MSYLFVHLDMNLNILDSYKFGYGYIFEIQQLKKVDWILIVFDKITYMRHSNNSQRHSNNSQRRSMNSPHLFNTFNVKEINTLNQCVGLKFLKMEGNKRWFSCNTYLDMDKQILLFGGHVYDLTKCSDTDNTFILKHIHYENDNIAWIYDN
jgi:hypothetical protein